MRRFRVNYIGIIGFRTCFWDAESEQDLRDHWALLYPNLAIQSVEAA